jgi:hypothetical protein
MEWFGPSLEKTNSLHLDAGNASSDVWRFALFLVLFLIFFFEVIVLFVVLILVGFVLILFLIFLFVEVVRDGVQMDRMRLRDFQFRFTLWAAQDFALLDFVLIHVNFGATIGAANHGTILRRNIRGAESRRIATATDHRIIYRE